MVEESGDDIQRASLETRVVDVPMVGASLVALYRGGMDKPESRALAADRVIHDKEKLLRFGRLCVVSDGSGYENGGGAAQTIVKEAYLNYYARREGGLSTENALKVAIRSAADKVVGGDTTIVAAVVEGMDGRVKVTYVNAGNSCLYLGDVRRKRRESLERLEPESVGGKRAANSMGGIRKGESFKIESVELDKDTLPYSYILLATNGLSVLDQPEIAETVNQRWPYGIRPGPGDLAHNLADRAQKRIASGNGSIGCILVPLSNSPQRVES
jgi:serine/threonine protein phosphatase PrpC